VQVSITFKNQQVLQNCSWEVKKGERVGLVGESTQGDWLGGKGCVVA
jgi:ATPase subunit of ABC transporter with duplicated ATPase domains